MHALFRPLARTVRHRLLQPRTGAQRLPRLALQQVQPALDRGTARRQVGLGRPAHRQRRLDVLLGDSQGPQDLAVLGVPVGHAVPFAFRRSYTALVFLAATWTAFPPTSKPATAPRQERQPPQVLHALSLSGAASSALTPSLWICWSVQPVRRWCHSQKGVPNRL